MSDSSSTVDASGKVFDLASFRRKKEYEDDSARGRKPLYVSHLTGKMSGSPHFDLDKETDFGERVRRIRSSLEKINSLMSELKKMSADKGAQK